jgi:hypothetical protein
VISPYQAVEKGDCLRAEPSSEQGNCLLRLACRGGSPLFNMLLCKSQSDERKVNELNADKRDNEPTKAEGKQIVA